LNSMRYSGSHSTTIDRYGMFGAEHRERSVGLFGSFSFALSLSRDRGSNKKPKASGI
jgi:hypothetical protein